MIHIINRHCNFSSLSAGKERPSFFSRQACFNNLKQTIADENECELHVLFDGNPEGHFVENEKNLIKLSSGSGSKSFIDAIHYALAISKDDNDIIYFLEDDYLHRPNWIPILKEGIGIHESSYVSLYDHFDKYVRVLPDKIKEPYTSMYKDLKSEITVTKSCHWRTVSSTTDTLAITKGLLQAYLSTFIHYSSIAPHSLDHARGIDLTSKGIILWTSLPGYSTHMAPDYMSPLTNWESI